MSQRSFSFLEKAYNPFLHALVMAGFGVTIMLLAKLANMLNLIEVDKTFPWLTTGAVFLLFAISNSVFSLASDNINTYFNKSVLGAALLVALLLPISYLFSGIWVTEADSFLWIYKVIGFCYLVFISIVNLIKKAVEYAQKEVWTQPRWKKRKR